MSGKSTADLLVASSLSNTAPVAQKQLPSVHRLTSRHTLPSQQLMVKTQMTFPPHLQPSDSKYFLWTTSFVCWALGLALWIARRHRNAKCKDWAQPVTYALLSATATHSTSNELEAESEAVFSWLVNNGATPAVPPVRLGIDSGGMRGMYAIRDILPDEVFLSVPQNLFLEEPSESAQGPPGIAAMALHLLQKKQQGTWDPYISLLPTECPMPSYNFTPAELAIIEDHRTIRAAQTERRLAEECWADMQRHRGEPVSQQDFFWALSILGSRCVELPGSPRRLLVPGVELANHTFNPLSFMRYQTTGTIRTVEMVAGDSGIHAGEEVTVCYGDFPSRSFLLSYGFLPKPNPHDTVVIFDGMRDLAKFCCDVYQRRGKNIRPEPLIAKLRSVLPAGPCPMFVAANGVDDRLMAAIQTIDQSEDFVSDVLLQRCQQIIGNYSTTVEDDWKMLEQAALSSNAKLAVEYRLSQKQILNTIITHFNAT